MRLIAPSFQVDAPDGAGAAGCAAKRGEAGSAEARGADTASAPGRLLATPNGVYGRSGRHLHPATEAARAASSPTKPECFALSGQRSWRTASFVLPVFQSCASEVPLHNLPSGKRETARLTERAIGRAPLPTTRPSRFGPEGWPVKDVSAAPGPVALPDFSEGHGASSERRSATEWPVWRACNPRTRGVGSVPARMDSGARGAAFDVVKHRFADNPYSSRTAPTQSRRRAGMEFAAGAAAPGGDLPYRGDPAAARRSPRAAPVER